MPRREVAERSHGPVVGLSTVSCGSRAMEGATGVRLGGWRRIMPFLFSLPPLRHELCGSAKYVAMPGSSRGSACRASSVPSSCVAPVRAAAGSRENMASCAATLAAAVSSGTIAAMGKRVRRPTSVCRLRPRADDAVGLPLAETAPVVLPVWAFADRRVFLFNRKLRF